VCIVEVIWEQGNPPFPWPGRVVNRTTLPWAQSCPANKPPRECSSRIQRERRSGQETWRGFAFPACPSLSGPRPAGFVEKTMPSSYGCSRTGFRVFCKTIIDLAQVPFKHDALAKWIPVPQVRVWAYLRDCNQETALSWVNGV